VHLKQAKMETRESYFQGLKFTVEAQQSTTKSSLYKEVNETTTDIL